MPCLETGVTNPNAAAPKRPTKQYNPADQRTGRLTRCSNSQTTEQPNIPPIDGARPALAALTSSLRLIASPLDAMYSLRGRENSTTDAEKPTAAQTTPNCTPAATAPVRTSA